MNKQNTRVDFTQGGATFCYGLFNVLEKVHVTQIKQKHTFVYNILDVLTIQKFYVQLSNRINLKFDTWFDNCLRSDEPTLFALAMVKAFCLVSVS